MGATLNDLARLPRSQAAGEAPSRKREGRHRAAARSTVHRIHPTQHYFAFLSYSHSDESVAAWLHEAIEQFRVPKRLVGQLTENGPIPRRLRPVFRDRGELAASDDLSEDIEEALAGSHFLIVLCSPAAVASRWANKEIEAFKRFHPDGCVLAAIVGGEPFASDIPGREAEECFPPALRVRYDQRGRPTSKRAEPIAADLREGRDGRQTGLLKVIAGMLGVGLDDLVQRETHRRQKRLAIVTIGSVIGMLFAIGLAVIAIQSRDAARDQRREADGLIGFMLGDLRQKLEPIDRLDVLDSVGIRALEYYEKQDKSDLSDSALAHRSKALTLMGEIAEARGDLNGALRRYREALAGTAEALRRSPDDPQRLFDHAQNVYWIGSIAMRRGETRDAGRQFHEYKRLADRMVELDPENPKWRIETVYATTNLGSLQIKQRRYAEAAATFQDGVSVMEVLGKADPGNREHQKLLIESVAWLAEAAERSGDLQLATAGRERQLGLLSPFVNAARPEPDFQQKAMIANMALARHLFERGGGRSALPFSAEAARIGQGLVRHDPANADWMGRSASAQLNHAAMLLRTGDMAQSRAFADKGCDLVGRALARDRSVATWQTTQRACLGLRAELALKDGAPHRASLYARQTLHSAQSEWTSDPLDRRFALATAYKLVGDVAWAGGDRTAAMSAWQNGLTAYPSGVALTPRQLRERSDLLERTGNRAEARRLSAQWSRMGFRASLNSRLSN